MHYILIEGNIGAGKTTFAQNLSSILEKQGYENFICKEEITPDIAFLLKRYYDNPSKWANITQMNIYFHRFEMWLRMREREGICIYDRSFIGDKVFLTTMYEQKFLSKEEYLCCVRVLDHFIEEMGLLDPDNALCIYLSAPVDRCIQNIEKRNRLNENTKITKEYLTLLERKHNEIISSLPMKVIRTTEYPCILDSHQYIDALSFYNKFKEVFCDSKRAC